MDEAGRAASITAVGVVMRTDTEGRFALRTHDMLHEIPVEATVLDLRVTVIGERIFAAAAETAKGEYKADIRMNAQVGWRPYTLPDDVAGKLLALVRRMDLQYGAADFRVRPDGQHVFLEINPAGQFLFVENAAKLPIAAAMAEHLASA